MLVSHSAPPHLEYSKFDATIFDRPLTTDDLTEGGSVFRLVWGRDYRPENAEAFAKLMDAGIRRQYNPIINLDMPGQPDCV